MMFFYRIQTKPITSSLQTVPVRNLSGVRCIGNSCSSVPLKAEGDQWPAPFVRGGSRQWRRAAQQTRGPQRPSRGYGAVTAPRLIQQHQRRATGGRGATLTRR
uniref:(California timema) hypothetical protein n=1 Tax=Timema californicum TaxID=61474 RepID=A0A7R9J1I9_TIMCA|nr:unnamed protein product [Timema californicum]